MKKENQTGIKPNGITIHVLPRKEEDIELNLMTRWNNSFDHLSQSHMSPKGDGAADACHASMRNFSFIFNFIYQKVLQSVHDLVYKIEIKKTHDLISKHTREVILFINYAKRLIRARRYVFYYFSWSFNYMFISETFPT